MSQEKIDRQCVYWEERLRKISVSVRHPLDHIITSCSWRDLKNGLSPALKQHTGGEMGECVSYMRPRVQVGGWYD